MTTETMRADVEEPDSGRAVRLELQVRDGVIEGGSCDTSTLPLLRETVQAVLEAAAGRRVVEVLDLSAGAVEKLLSPSATRQVGDVSFALRAVQNALLGRTH